MKLEIVKKAWYGWNPLDDEAYYIGESLYYAESLHAAKVTVSNEWGCDYKNVKVRRARHRDMVMYGGRVRVRESVKGEIARVRNTDLFIKKLSKYKDSDRFYVQHDTGYVGNSVVWWALGSNGYTTDIDKAHKYSKEEIIGMFSSKREEDKIWAVSEVLKGIKRHVDSQYLDYGKRI